MVNSSLYTQSKQCTPIASTTYQKGLLKLRENNTRIKHFNASNYVLSDTWKGLLYIFFQCPSKQAKQASPPVWEAFTLIVTLPQSKVKWKSSTIFKCSFFSTQVLRSTPDNACARSDQSAFSILNFSNNLWCFSYLQVTVQLQPTWRTLETNRQMRCFRFLSIRLRIQRQETHLEKGNEDEQTANHVSQSLVSCCIHSLVVYSF